jgi:hypothetical protein
MTGMLEDLKSNLGAMREEQKASEEKIKKDLELKDQEIKR